MDGAKTVENIKRWAAVITAILVLLVSLSFSNKGFGFEVKNAIWAGWILSLAITTMELIFNSQLNYNAYNWTIYALGFLSYLYGIATNFVGIWISQGNQGFDVLWANPLSGLFALIVAAFIEIIPEIMFVYGIAGILEGGESDLIKNMFGIRDKGGHKPSGMGSRPPMRPMGAMAVGNPLDDDFSGLQPRPITPPQAGSKRKYYQGLGRDGQERPR